MAVAILTTKNLETGETTNESTSFLKNTIKSIFKRHESEIDYNNTLKQFSLEEVRHHDSWTDCWVIIYDRVYNITKFLHHVSRMQPKGYQMKRASKIQKRVQSSLQ
jgi:cytochrome b involved in lipid metabolism